MSIDIYEINYSNNLRADGGNQFQIFDCKSAPAWEQREIFHMHRFYSEGRHLKSDYSGLVSPKFSAKTKIAGQQFVEFIEENPGYDVYFINPFPHLAYLAFNVWDQGKFWHEKVCDLANLVLITAGFEIDVSQLARNKSDTLLYSNYWVGNRTFWDRYMAFTKRLMDAIDNLPSISRTEFFAIAPHPTAATYYPFIFERMFSTFLLMETGLKFLAYPWSRADVVRHCDTEMEALLINEWADMIDQWDVIGKYTPDQRQIFASLLKVTQLYRTPQSSNRRGGKFRNLYGALANRFAGEQIISAVINDPEQKR